MSGKPSGKHVIVLNGKQYDTKTGQLIHAQTKPHTPEVKHKPSAHHAPAKPHLSTPSTPAARATHPKTRPSNIDGFTRPSSATRSAAHPSRPANHAARKPQRSHPVMRAATKHPVISVAKPVEDAPAPAVIASAPSALGIDTARVARAKRIHQAKQISRFGTFEPSVQTPVEPTISDREETLAAAQPSVSPQPVPAALQETHIERAIAAATSHSQPKPDVKPTKRHHKVARKLHMKPRTLTAATAALLVIGVGGILIRQNAPAMQVRLAGSRAGISSNLPSYVPSGYNLAEGVDYKEGEVTLTYQSQARDGRSFTITQAESFWTSDSLRENYLETISGTYRTSQENGKTIYLYEGGATWVDGGIWYKIDTSGASLSDAQLIDLINGL